MRFGAWNLLVKSSSAISMPEDQSIYDRNQMIFKVGIRELER